MQWLTTTCEGAVIARSPFQAPFSSVWWLITIIAPDKTVMMVRTGLVTVRMKYFTSVYISGWGLLYEKIVTSIVKISSQSPSPPPPWVVQSTFIISSLFSSHLGRVWWRWLARTRCRACCRGWRAPTGCCFWPRTYKYSIHIYLVVGVFLIHMRSTWSADGMVRSIQISIDQVWAWPNWEHRLDKDDRWWLWQYWQW